MISSNKDQLDPDHEDEEAAHQQQAARHRYEASELVRNHLESHAVNNPGASSDYVTWIATLHPENADVTIDQRFFIPGNPWWTIYEEIKYNHQIPTVTAVPISNEQKPQPRKEDTDEEDEDGRHEDAPPGGFPPQSLFLWKMCSPLCILCGILLYVPAVVAVLYCELVALLLCYFPAMLFFHAARALSPPTCCTGIGYGVCRLLYGIFSVCDSIVLLASVLVTELVGFMALVVGFITGGVLWSRYFHQHIRKSCHGLRVVFRLNKTWTCCTTKHSINNPSRQFFFLSCYDDDDDDNNTNEGTSNTNIIATTDHEANDGNNTNNTSDMNHTTAFHPAVSVVAPPMPPPVMPPPMVPPRSHDEHQYYYNP